MSAYVIPDNIRAKVDKLFEGKAREGAIKALESGKVVHVGPHKLKAVKQEDKGKGAATTAAPSSATSKKAADKKEDDKQ
jgi:hypothetical protein